MTIANDVNYLKSCCKDVNGLIPSHIASYLGYK